MSQRKLLVVGGPNGAGKTTFAEEYLANHSRLYLSADLIAAKMSLDDPTAARVAAGRAFLSRFNDCLNGGEDVVVESTLSGRSFRRQIQLARNAGWHVSIFFVFVDSDDVSIARVEHRVRKGGHDVPEVDIRRRFRRSADNFWNLYKDLADEWWVYYNSYTSFDDVAFGSPESISIRDESRFRQFEEIVKGPTNA